MRVCVLLIVLVCSLPDYAQAVRDVDDDSIASFAVDETPTTASLATTASPAESSSTSAPKVENETNSSSNATESDQADVLRCDSKVCKNLESLYDRLGLKETQVQLFQGDSDNATILTLQNASMGFRKVAEEYEEIKANLMANTGIESLIDRPEKDTNASAYRKQVVSKVMSSIMRVTSATFTPEDGMINIPTSPLQGLLRDQVYRNDYMAAISKLISSSEAPRGLELYAGNYDQNVVKSLASRIQRVRRDVNFISSNASAAQNIKTMITNEFEASQIQRYNVFFRMVRLRNNEHFKYAEAETPDLVADLTEDEIADLKTGVTLLPEGDQDAAREAFVRNMIWLCTANGWGFDGLRMTVLARTVEDMVAFGRLLHKDSISEDFKLFAFKNTGWQKSGDLGYLGIHVVMILKTAKGKEMLTELKLSLAEMVKGAEAEETLDNWRIVYEQLRKSKANSDSSAPAELPSVENCQMTAKALFTTLLHSHKSSLEENSGMGRSPSMLLLGMMALSALAHYFF